MNLYDNKLYINDINYVSKLDIPWSKFQNSTMLISGATGMIGSFLIDVIMNKNLEGLNCTIYAISRNLDKLNSRFSKWKGNTRFQGVVADIKTPIKYSFMNSCDFVIHMASNTHPVQYATDPVGTITTNLFGLANMLDLSVEHKSKRFMYTSSNEIYGENRGDVELFTEDYCGYINSNTLRAGYPESKRCGETLCQAYRSQKNLDVVIPRLTRSYGPTMLASDTKAISQFIKNGVLGKDVVLKSLGTQYYSYTYVADAVSGLLYILLLGESGMAYNISDIKSDITLKALAEIISTIGGGKVVYEIPDTVEAAGYSKATKARLDSTELRKLGWKAKYNITDGIKRTIKILSSIDTFKNNL